MNSAQVITREAGLKDKNTCCSSTSSTSSGRRPGKTAAVATTLRSSVTSTSTSSGSGSGSGKANSSGSTPATANGPINNSNDSNSGSNIGSSSIGGNAAAGASHRRFGDSAGVHAGGDVGTGDGGHTSSSLTPLSVLDSFSTSARFVHATAAAAAAAAAASSSSRHGSPTAAATAAYQNSQHQTGTREQLSDRSHSASSFLGTVHNSINGRVRSNTHNGPPTSPKRGVGPQSTPGMSLRPPTLLRGLLSIGANSSVHGEAGDEEEVAPQSCLSNSDQCCTLSSVSTGVPTLPQLNRGSSNSLRNSVLKNSTGNVPSLLSLHVANTSQIPVMPELSCTLTLSSRDDAAMVAPAAVVGSRSSSLFGPSPSKPDFGTEGVLPAMGIYGRKGELSHEAAGEPNSSNGGGGGGGGLDDSVKSNSIKGADATLLTAWERALARSTPALLAHTAALIGAPRPSSGASQSMRTSARTASPNSVPVVPSSAPGTGTTGDGVPVVVVVPVPGVLSSTERRAAERRRAEERQARKAAKVARKREKELLRQQAVAIQLGGAQQQLRVQSPSSPPQPPSRSPPSSSTKSTPEEQVLQQSWPQSQPQQPQAPPPPPPPPPPQQQQQRKGKSNRNAGPLRPDETLSGVPSGSSNNFGPARREVGESIFATLSTPMAVAGPSLGGELVNLCGSDTQGRTPLTSGAVDSACGETMKFDDEHDQHDDMLRRQHTNEASGHHRGTRQQQRQQEAAYGVCLALEDENTNTAGSQQVSGTLALRLPEGSCRATGSVGSSASAERLVATRPRTYCSSDAGSATEQARLQRDEEVNVPSKAKRRLKKRKKPHHRHHRRSNGGVNDDAEKRPSAAPIVQVSPLVAAGSGVTDGNSNTAAAAPMLVPAPPKKSHARRHRRHRAGGGQSGSRRSSHRTGNVENNNNNNSTGNHNHSNAAFASSPLQSSPPRCDTGPAAVKPLPTTDTTAAAAAQGKDVYDSLARGAADAAEVIYSQTTRTSPPIVEDGETPSNTSSARPSRRCTSAGAQGPRVVASSATTRPVGAGNGGPSPPRTSGAGRQPFVRRQHSGSTHSAATNGIQLPLNHFGSAMENRLVSEDLDALRKEQQERSRLGVGDDDYTASLQDCQHEEDGVANRSASPPQAPSQKGVSPHRPTAAAGSGAAAIMELHRQQQRVPVHGEEDWDSTSRSSCGSGSSSPFKPPAPPPLQRRRQRSSSGNSSRRASHDSSQRHQPQQPSSSPTAGTLRDRRFGASGSSSSGSSYSSPASPHCQPNRRSRPSGRIPSGGSLNANATKEVYHCLDKQQQRQQRHHHHHHQHHQHQQQRRGNSSVNSTAVAGARAPAAPSSGRRKVPSRAGEDGRSSWSSYADSYSWSSYSASSSNAASWSSGYSSSSSSSSSGSGYLSSWSSDGGAVRVAAKIPLKAGCTTAPPARAFTDVAYRMANPAVLQPYAEPAVIHEWNLREGCWGRVETYVVLSPDPFSQGNMRASYHMVDMRRLNCRLITKRYLKSSVSDDQYFDDVSMHSISGHWARLYNAARPPKTVKFVPAAVLELPKRNPPLTLAIEPELEGTFRKYNNNCGYVPRNARWTPQAFSHFTYHASNHEIMIVDIQGVGDIYTDPQILSPDGEGYGRGNLGRRGIRHFLRSHCCNGVCKALGLPAVGTPTQNSQGLSTAGNSNHSSSNTNAAATGPRQGGSGGATDRRFASPEAKAIREERLPPKAFTKNASGSVTGHRGHPNGGGGGGGSSGGNSSGTSSGNPQGTPTMHSRATSGGAGGSSSQILFQQQQQQTAAPGLSWMLSGGPGVLFTPPPPNMTAGPPPPGFGRAINSNSNNSSSNTHVGTPLLPPSTALQPQPQPQPQPPHNPKFMRHIRHQISRNQSTYFSNANTAGGGMMSVPSAFPYASAGSNGSNVVSDTSNPSSRGPATPKGSSTTQPLLCPPSGGSASNSHRVHQHHHTNSAVANMSIGHNNNASANSNSTSLTPQPQRPPQLHVPPSGSTNGACVGRPLVLPLSSMEVRNHTPVGSSSRRHHRR